MYMQTSWGAEFALSCRELVRSLIVLSNDNVSICVYVYLYIYMCVFIASVVVWLFCSMHSFNILVVVFLQLPDQEMGMEAKLSVPLLGSALIGNEILA